MDVPLFTMIKINQDFAMTQVAFYKLSQTEI